MEGTPRYSRESTPLHKEEAMAKTTSDKLTITPILCLPVPLGREEEAENQSEVKPRKEGRVEGT